MNWKKNGLPMKITFFVLMAGFFNYQLAKNLLDRESVDIIMSLIMPMIWVLFGIMIGRREE